MRNSVGKCAAFGCLVLAATPMPAAAQSDAVPALLRQARYWEGKGRRDLAVQAYRRVLAIDPSNAQARRGVAGTVSAPAAPRPQPAPRAQSAPTRSEPTRPATRPAPKPAPAPVSRADRLGRSRVAAFAALNEGNLSRAADLFRGVLRSSPNDGDALGGLGIVTLRQEKFDEARTLLERASTRGNAGRWSEALESARFFSDLRTAQADFDAGRVGEAQATAERLSRVGGEKGQPATELLARIYEQQGRYADAAALFTNAAREAGGPAASRLRVSAIRAQAQAAVAASQPAEAQRLFDRAVSLEPNDPWLRYDYARFLIDQRRPMDAHTVIAPLAQSAVPEALFASALFAQEQGQLDMAAQLIDRIPAGSRTDEMTTFALGLRSTQAVERARALGRQGQQATALQSLRQIADTPGLAASPLASIASAMLELGDPAGAGVVAQRAAGLPAATVDDFDPIVRVLAASGQDMAAAAATDRAAQLASASPTGARTLATIRAAQATATADRMRLNGQYAPAFDLLQQAWAGAPGDRDILAALARLYQSGNLHAQAAQTYRMILATTPTDRDALIGFAESAAAAGQNDVARDAVRNAIRAAPQDYRPYLAAARIEQARGDDSAARKYLARARDLYVGQNAPNGGNPFGGNPFATASAANPFASQPQAPANPFAPVPASSNPFAMAPGGGYAPVAPVPYGTAQAMPFGGASPAAFGTAPSPVPGFLAPAPAGGWQQGAVASSAPAVMESADPVLRGIEADLRQLADRNATRVDVDTGYRQRSGEVGLSELREVNATAKLSTGMAGGRLGVQAQAVVIDAGRPTGSGLARYGRNGTAEAQAIVDQLPSQLAAAETEHAAGAAIAATYDSDLVKADFGTTPIGFDKVHAAGGIAVTPRLSENSTARVFAEYRPVTDSVTSYAGSIDPVTGTFWGSVMRAGGGASLSWDDDGTGVYADGSYFQYQGTNVPDNSSVQFNVGGYARAYRTANSTLTIGINANYQTYDNNQNYFTFGHGGYFSPQSFVSVSFPVRYSMRTSRLDMTANVAPGFQSYGQDAAPLYPTDPAAQSQLDVLKSLNNDVRARYDSLSQTGFGIAADGSLYYGLNGATRIGGDVKLNTFGQYRDLRTSVGIKQTLGGEP